MENGLKIEVLDTTLRDGMQGEGITFSVEDKISLCRVLDKIGVTYIEGGNPFSNPKDMEFFKRAKDELALKSSKLCAFGSTRRKWSDVEEDEGINSLINCGVDTIVIFGKCWRLHATEILGTSDEENFSMIYDTVSFLTKNGKEVIFDGEHFFDGYRDDPEFAVNAIRSAIKGGAKTIVLCDTNGGTFPYEIGETVKKINNLFPDIRIGVHCHNDCGMAVACTVSAVRSGAVHIQGTFTGIGERCGNAALFCVIPNLQLKLGYSLLPDKSIKCLYEYVREIAETENINISKYEPYIGSSAFAHKAGMHSDAVLKNSRSFEHIDPEAVGNKRKFLMSEMTGRGAVSAKISSLFDKIDKQSPATQRVIECLKEMEHKGYQYEGAESSFDLMVKKCTGKYKPYFELINYKTIEERPYGDCSSTATIKIKVGDKVQLSAAEGQGPIHALDKALRSAIEVFYPELKDVKLIDYKVRVMDSKAATAAKVRVLITSTDGKNIWTTVGCSEDIIEASWLALVDSVEYTLSKAEEENS